jgi:dTDP-4-amino-4,6-dideoxygalactose transaminase
MINPRFYFLTKKILARKYKQDIFRLRSIQSNLNENLIYTAYQAFLGIRMLNKLPGFNSSREHKASLYSKTFAVLEGYYQPEAANHFFLRYPVICMSGIAKTRLEECLVNNNFVLSTGNYPVLSTLNIKPALFDPEFPVSSYIASNILTLPTHFFVSEKRIEELLKCIANYPS